MTLQAWIALTPEQRNIERERWHRETEDRDRLTEESWRPLLREACDRFRNEFGQHPLVNYVDEGTCRISVTTALYPFQFIEELPSRYCGFIVMQEPVNANRDYYLRSWQILFRELLDWSESRTSDWAKKWEDDLGGKSGWMFYHEDELYWALPEIMRAAGITHSDQRDSIKMSSLRSAIQTGNSWPMWLTPFDWGAVRRRVNDVLAPHGGKLPR